MLVRVAVVCVAVVMAPASVGHAGGQTPADRGQGPAAGVQAPAGSAEPPASPGRLRGQVRAPGLKPVPGATAAAVRAEAPPLLAVTATDALGFLSMDGVPPGTWRLVVFAPGYLPGAVDGLSVGGPFRAVADLTLRPGAGTAPVMNLPAAPAGDAAGSLRVLTVADYNTPLVGVRLRLDPVGHRADPLLADTSETGEVLFPALPAGHWRVSIGRAGWTRLLVPDVEIKGGPATILARLLPLPEGTPIPVEDLLPPARLLE